MIMTILINYYCPVLKDIVCVLCIIIIGDQLTIMCGSD